MNRIFCLFLMVPFMALASSLQDGLVAWYKFDGNANDSSGNGNNGTVHGVALTTDRNGNPDSAYSFDGDDWISVAHDDSLNPDALTVSVWMKPSDWYNGHIPIICKSNASWQEGSYRSQIDNHGDTVTFMLRGSASADNCIEFGKWQLITLTLDKQCMCVYRNGVLVGRDDAPGAIQKKSDDIGIGRNIVGATEYFKGVMDDFRIYSRALSATEVKSLYDGEVSDGGGLRDGLVAWYKFDGNLNDASGNGYALSGESAAYGIDRNQGSSAALSCSGATELRPSKTLEVDETFTVACWVKAGKDTAVYSEDGRMYRTCYDEGNVVLAPGFSQKYPDDGAGVGFSVGKNGIAVYEHAGVYLPVVLMYEANIGDGWNHVVVQVENNGAPKVYLNGALVRTGVQGAKPKRSVVIMADGAHALCGGGYGHFSGSIDDLRIYNRALAATEIKSLYEDGGSSYEGGGGVQSDGGLAHRWSFNGDLTDSVGGQTATAVGSVTTDGKQYTLAGGSRGSSYINLGSNILPNDGSGVTLEVWGTQKSVKKCGRIWDIGGNTSTDMLMAWTCQSDINADGICIRQIGGDQLAKLSPYTLGTEFHVATVFKPQADGTWKVYYYKQDASTGATLASATLDSKGTSWSLTTQNQTDCWLGHSHWSDNNDANASYNEVRVWKRALTEAELTANALLGSDVLPGDSSEPEIPIYTITFDANGGTPTPTAVARKEGEVCGTLPTVTRKGYLFLGWFIAKDDGVQVMEDSIVDSSCTLYAHWQENRHTIKFDTGCGAVLPDVMQLDGFTFGDLPVMTRSGFDFLGWYTDAVGGVQYTKHSIITADCVLFAHWKCHFNFEWSGGGRLDICSGTRRTDEAQGIAMDSAWGDGGARAVVSVDGVEKAESKGADEFVWSGDETKEYTLKHQVYDAQGRTVGEPHVAKIAWTSRAAVTFDGGNGEEAFSREYDKSYAYGELPSVTKTGHTFAGWYTAAEGGEKVEAGAQFDGSVSKLYAHWTVNQYGVKFDKNGGEGMAGDVTVAYGVVVPMDGVAFRKSGYRLAGWATAADGAAVYGQSGAMSNLTAEANGCVQLYAVWEPTTVGLKSFKQRYPWNGFVDVECDVGAEGRVGLMLIDEESGTNFTAKTLFCQSGGVTNSALWMAEGPQKFIWDAGSDLPDGFKTSKLKAKTCFVEGEE